MAVNTKNQTVSFSSKKTLNSQLDLVAKEMGITKSQVIIQCLEEAMPQLMELVEIQKQAKSGMLSGTALAARLLRLGSGAIHDAQMDLAAALDASREPLAVARDGTPAGRPRVTAKRRKK